MALMPMLLLLGIPPKLICFLESRFLLQNPGGGDSTATSLAGLLLFRVVAHAGEHSLLPDVQVCTWLAAAVSIAGLSTPFSRL